VSDAARRRARALGYFEAIAAACLWGSSGIFAVHLFRMGVPPESVALLRPVAGAAFLLAWLLVARPTDVRVDRRGLLILGLGGGLAVGIFQIAYQLSTDAVGVPTTVALLYIAPALVVSISGPLLGEWPTRARVGLVLVTLTGVWLSVLGAHAVPATFGTTGLVWGVVAACGYAAYTLFGRMVAPTYGSARTVLYSTVGSCAVLVIVVPLISGSIVLPSTPRAWTVLLAFGLLTIAVAHTLFFDALARIEAGRVSIAAAIEPVVAGLLATVLLAQGLSPIGWIGIALVVSGVAGVGVTRDRADASDRPDAVAP
jgi:drug/metabolite transporter (DMT)-like permease